MVFHSMRVCWCQLVASPRVLDPCQLCWNVASGSVLDRWLVCWSMREKVAAGFRPQGENSPFVPAEIWCFGRLKVFEERCFGVVRLHRSNSFATLFKQHCLLNMQRHLQLFGQPSKWKESTRMEEVKHPELCTDLSRWVC